MKKVRLLLTLIFGLMGLLFLLTGGGIGTAMSINSEGMVPVEGVIVAMNDDMPLILYEVDGQTYYRQSNVSSSTFRCIEIMQQWELDRNYPGIKM